MFDPKWSLQLPRHVIGGSMANKGKIWVVIANSSKAEIYAVTPGEKIEKVHQTDFPDGRKKSRDVYSDKPGRGFSRMGHSVGQGVRHALSTETDLHEHERQVFGHEIAEILRKAHAEHLFEKLALIAPPEFLGDLRQILPDSVRKAIYKELNKDLPDFMSETEKTDKICKLLELRKPEAPRLRS